MESVDIGQSSNICIVNNYGRILFSSFETGMLSVAENDTDLRLYSDPAIVGLSINALNGMHGIERVKIDGTLCYVAFAPMKTYISDIQSITAEKERMGTELSLAKRIQTDMLPGIFPAFPCRSDFDIFASMTPAKEVGGDFYDFFLIDDDHLALVIADVSGKGVPAALFMMGSMIRIKNSVEDGLSPAKALEKVNDQICAVHGAVNSFVGNAPQFDDLTMLCVEFKGQQA